MLSQFPARWCCPRVAGMMSVPEQHGLLGRLSRGLKTTKPQEPKSLGCFGLLTCSAGCTHLPAEAGSWFAILLILFGVSQSYRLQSWCDIGSGLAPGAVPLPASLAVSAGGYSAFPWMRSDAQEA